MSAETPRILVVDDEPGIREGCRRILVAEGYEVQTAEDGGAGLARVTGPGLFSAALIDLKMPVMGGLDLLERVRQIDPDLVAIMITAYATIETAVEATKRGAYGYIPKPFTPDEMLLPVRNGLERRALVIEARKLREERERRLLEVSFERSKCGTVINCMTDGVVVVNRDRKVVLRNAAAARLLPDAARVSLPAEMRDALPSEGIQEVILHALHSQALPVIESREARLEDRTFLVNASPVTDARGEVLGAVAVLRDITAIKKLDAAKSTFVSLVAHEVKRPLGIIEGYLDVVLSGLTKDPDKTRDMMQKALVRARTLRVMVTELLNLTAMETGRFSLTRAPLDLRAVAAEVVESYAERAAEKRIELRLEPSDANGSARVLADRGAMTNVIGNLVDNAIKYTPQGGHVRVRVACGPDGVQATVQDDGVGISPADRDRLFEEFFRARNAAVAEVPGTGLGLAVVKRLVDLHDGKVAVQTAEGRGSAFTVTLPLLDAGVGD